MYVKLLVFEANPFYYDAHAIMNDMLTQVVRNSACSGHIPKPSHVIISLPTVRNTNAPHRYEIDNATAVQLTFNTSVTGDAVPSGFLERYIHSQVRSIVK